MALSIIICLESTPVLRGIYECHIVKKKQASKQTTTTKTHDSDMVLAPRAFISSSRKERSMEKH